METVLLQCEISEEMLPHETLAKLYVVIRGLCPFSGV